MKTDQPLRAFSFLFFTAALVFLGSGCATQEQHSFNTDFNQNLPTAPNYFIEDAGTNQFTITVSQGRASSGQERITDVKRAATTVAEYEAKHRGWQNWRLDYIYERNHGWMHVVKAKVVWQNAVEFQGHPPGTQP